ncbi:hypothetical protein [Pseudactinotalea sp.]|uniref:hypothetical protein n=1 Tax=Pseudactinotalea sp. TaxID=1926260 RepID=UPI003B3A771A
MELCWQVDPETIYRDLEDWAWLPGLTDLRPVMVTVFADVILQGADGYWFLDTMEGHLAREWPDAAAVNAALGTSEGQDQFLMGGLAHAAAAAGVERPTGQVYVLTPPPVVGGSFAVENIMAMELPVALSLSGQLHRQLTDLPPGTPITGVTTSD